MTGAARSPTGVDGFDAILGGGFPTGRLAALLGTPGAGKTVLALETLTRAAEERDEPGLFVSFEETPDAVTAALRGFRWAGEAFPPPRLELLDARLPAAILHGGDFDLGGLLATLGARISATGARWLVLDGLDVLLEHLDEPAAIRREVCRLREWLEDRDLTVLLTAKASRHTDALADRFAFLEFAVDCVVLLQSRQAGRTNLRTVRVTKLRGGQHSANEFPFTISSRGVEVFSVDRAPREPIGDRSRVSTGVERLDAMLRGGYLQGSSVLISGAPGTAKTTLSGSFAAAACERGEDTLYVSFDEGGEEVVANLRSVGIDLQPHVDAGRLRLLSLRSSADSPGAQAARIREALAEAGARNVVVDPISAMARDASGSSRADATMQCVDLCKQAGATLVSTSLADDVAGAGEASEASLSTVADAWIHLSYVSQGGERNRTLTIVKCRGSAHSHQVRELVLSEDGVDLADVYTAGGEVLMGTLRWEREEEERQKAERLQRALERGSLEAARTVEELEGRLRATELELELARKEREYHQQERRELEEAEQRRERGVRDRRAGGPPLPGSPPDPSKGGG